MKSNSFLPVVLAASLTTIVGCNTDDSLKSGILLDSAVVGLDYFTETHSGTTGPGGSFQYREGETVTFELGDIKLPPVLASALITPLDLAGTNLVNDKVASNIARFLQALDSDGNPDNGITIDPETHAAALDQMIDFSEQDFDGEAAAFLASLQGDMPSHDEARAHFESTLSGLIDGKSFRKEIRNGLSAHYQDLIHGPGYLSSEFSDTCKDLGELLFAGIGMGINACFDSDGTGSVAVSFFDQAFDWSVDGDGGLQLSGDGGWTIRLIRLVDEERNDAGALVEIIDLPGYDALGDLRMISDISELAP